MTHLMNDNEAPRPVLSLESPDAHGQAAMLLVESLIHTLIARSVIRVEDAIEVVTIALDVKMEIADDLGDSDDTLDKSLALLSAVRQSLGYDIL